MHLDADTYGAKFVEYAITEPHVHVNDKKMPCGGRERFFWRQCNSRGVHQ